MKCIDCDKDAIGNLTWISSWGARVSVNVCSQHGVEIQKRLTPLNLSSLVVTNAKTKNELDLINGESE